MTVVTLRAFGCVALLLGRRRLVTRHSPFRNSLLVVFFCRSIPRVHFESGPAFIKRNGVSEEPDVVVRSGKREVAPQQDTHRAHSVPKIKCIEDVRKLRGQREIYSPNADKFDVDVNRDASQTSYQESFSRPHPKAEQFRESCRFRYQTRINFVNLF
jgi:hypothetical protein